MAEISRARTHPIATSRSEERDHAREPVKVLYVAGWGRSGSTLLDTLLGGVDGFFSTGELRNLWHEGLGEGRKCGCGRQLADCPLWSEVLAEAFGAERVDARAIDGWQRKGLRTRHTLGIVRAGSQHGRLSPTLEAYRDVSARIYAAIANATGARVIVDSSKVPSNAALLTLMPQVQPFLVQLVRDPRASAFSWQREKARLDRDQAENLPRFGLVKSSVNWVAFNTAAEALRRRYPPGSYMLVRYEDLVARPREVLAGIVELVGERSSELPVTNEGAVSLGGNHTVSGNPSRFRSGSFEIREDAEWKASQRTWQRFLVTCLSLPLLRRYGYDVRV